MPLYYGNNMIDGDDGSHPFSPNFKEPPKEDVQCTECGEWYDVDELRHTVILDEDICLNCWQEQEEMAKNNDEKFN